MDPLTYSSWARRAIEEDRNLSLLQPCSSAAEKVRNLRALVPQGRRGKQRLSSQQSADINLEVSPGNILVDSKGTCSSAPKSQMPATRVPCTLAPSDDTSDVDATTIHAISPPFLRNKEGEGSASSKFVTTPGTSTELGPGGQARSPISGGCIAQFEARLRLKFSYYSRQSDHGWIFVIKPKEVRILKLREAYGCTEEMEKGKSPTKRVSLSLPEVDFHSRLSESHALAGGSEGHVAIGDSLVESCSSWLSEKIRLWQNC